MADVYEFSIKTRVQVATHDTDRRCRKELEQLVTEALEPLLTGQHGPTGAIDCITTFKVKVKPR